MQVEVEIETMDRGGTFLGSLRTCEGSKNVCFHMGPDLLEAGLAKLHPSFDPDRVPGGRELAAAQERAQSARLKVCKHFNQHPPPSCYPSVNHPHNLPSHLSDSESS